MSKTDQWFRKGWDKSGRKLDGGKRLERSEGVCAVGSIRFKRSEDVPLEKVGQRIARVSGYIARLESLCLKRRPVNQIQSGQDETLSLFADLIAVCETNPAKLPKHS